VLVLTRRSGESIRIGDEISIRVLEIQRGQVRVAIEAPREIPVHREEIWERVREENRRAAALERELDPATLWRQSRGEAG
jgi:carbon storage regulator